MAKKEKIKDEIEETVEETVEETATDTRMVAWLEFLAKAEKANPVKFAQKKARGEFDQIPSKFVG